MVQPNRNYAHADWNITSFCYVTNDVVSINDLAIILPINNLRPFTFTNLNFGFQSFLFPTVIMKGCWMLLTACLTRFSTLAELYDVLGAKASKTQTFLFYKVPPFCQQLLQELMALI